MVIKRCPEPCSSIPLFHENRFNPFDSVTIGNAAFQTFVSSGKDDFAKVLANL